MEFEYPHFDRHLRFTKFLRPSHCTKLSMYLLLWLMKALCPDLKFNKFNQSHASTLKRLAKRLYRI